MPTIMKTKEGNVQSNKNGFDLCLIQWDRIIGKSDNILKIDRKSTNVRNGKERIPKRRATTSVLNVVTYITTAKKASPVLSTKPRPSAPVIGDSADMGKGK